MTNKTILIATGGTGGHIFPGLAVAAEFKKRGYRVFWLGTKNGMEATLVGETDIPIHYFPVSGIRGKGLLALLKSPVNIVRSLYFAVKYIKELNPNCVIGLGGFVSGPAGLASRLLRKPLVIHEQNALAGTTNRMLAKIASKVLCAFPCNLKKATVIGNPVREELESIEKNYAASKTRVNVLILGGSRGARALNQYVAKAIADAKVSHHIKIKHQCGAGRVEEAITAYKDENVQAEVVPFISDMAQAFEWADFMICRAGALTVSEVASVGLASVMIPYPYAIDDHQTANAKYLEAFGATEIVQETEFSSDKLQTVLSRILGDKKQIVDMSLNAKKAGRHGVAKNFVDICEGVLGVAA